MPSGYLTVENNNSFYRLPSRETFESWRERTPDDFVMAVKASRYLTHVRRLRDPAEPVARLLGAAAGLGRKLGPILLQLPPTLQGRPGPAGRVPEGIQDRRRRPGRTRPAGRGRAAARQLVDRGDPAGPGGSRRPVVLGRPAQPPDHAPMADRDLGVPAVPRGHRAAVAPVRAAGVRSWVTPAGRHLAGHGRRVRLLQQRPGRGRGRSTPPSSPSQAPAPAGRPSPARPRPANRLPFASGR